ncbi:MAG: PASTA domain-containing protein [Bacteroidales bacterium]|nr:PASTA domain-containing protein [Bacteroidales bacterium]
MDFLKFLISKLFFKHLFLAIVISFFMLLITFLALRIYTRHGQALSVPDLRGKFESEIMEILLEKELKYEIVDSVYNIAYERGTVVDQNPPPEFQVKKGRTIFLTINAIIPEMTRMPDVVGVSLRQARAIIETAGLKIGRLSYVPDIAVNNVLQQKYKGNVIEEGDSIPKGAVINLVLGRGLSDDKTAAPDLIGLHLSTAIDKITVRYLNLGAIIYDGTVENEEDSLNAFIWKQRPVFDIESLLNLGSAVDIWLTVDSTKLPDAIIPEEEIPVGKDGT